MTFRLARRTAALVSMTAAALAVAAAAAAAASGGLALRTDRAAYAPGAAITVSWSGDGTVSGQMWIEPASAPVDATHPAANWLALGGRSGRVTFSGLDLEPGRYEVRVSNMNVYPAVLVARAPLTVTGAAAKPKTKAAPRPAAPAKRAAPAVEPPVKTTKRAYRDGEKVVVRWSGFRPGTEVELWLEPVSAPLRIVPTGSMHTGYESGRWAFPSPGPGETWEVRYFVLGGGGKAHRGPRFEVGPSSVAAPRPGSYGCYFDDGPRGLSRSSLGALSLGPGSTYSALGGGGRYAWSRARAQLRMTSGPLKGRVAVYRQRGSDGKPAVVFRRRANEVHGKPTLDISDTYCTFGAD